MSDRDLRTLRRDAALGDAEAESRLERAAQRADLFRYVVRVSADKPVKYGRRRNRVAVMCMEPDAPVPAMISDRARGCVEVVETWDGLNVGKTRRSAYHRALADAIDLARDLGGGREPEVIQ